MSTAPPAPEVLAFDVFGTVVDWFAGVSREVAETIPELDAGEFTLAWRDGYKPAMRRVAAGELPWTRVDDLHRMILEDLLVRFGVNRLDEESVRHLNTAWHRLDPWPDSVAGLARLKTRFIVCTLSNGNINLLTRMARFGGLPWDCVLSAEVFRRYKPDPATYLGVVEVFDVDPAAVMLVAAHQDDLDGARDCGLATACVERPDEFGGRRPKDLSPDPANTLHARDLGHLADLLGC